MESSALLVFFLAAVSLVGLAMLFSSYVPPSSSNDVKFEPMNVVLKPLAMPGFSTLWVIICLQFCFSFLMWRRFFFFHGQL
jgi:hypothetical protein